MGEAPHKRLNVWQKSMNLIEQIYKITKKYPEEEKFGLISQMRRAAISIASNIAEGCARFTRKEQVQFYMMARGSISELDTHIEISYRLGLIKAEDKDMILDKITEIGKMLNGLIRLRKELSK
jgi:four helix bundle protein